MQESCQIISLRSSITISVFRFSFSFSLGVARLTEFKVLYRFLSIFIDSISKFVDCRRQWGKGRPLRHEASDRSPSTDEHRSNGEELETPKASLGSQFRSIARERGWLKSSVRLRHSSSSKILRDSTSTRVRVRVRDFLLLLLRRFVLSRHAALPLKLRFPFGVTSRNERKNEVCRHYELAINRVPSIVRAETTRTREILRDTSMYIYNGSRKYSNICRRIKLTLTLARNRSSRLYDLVRTSYEIFYIDRRKRSELIDSMQLFHM